MVHVNKLYLYSADSLIDRSKHFEDTTRTLQLKCLAQGHTGAAMNHRPSGFVDDPLQLLRYSHPSKENLGIKKLSSSKRLG